MFFLKINLVRFAFVFLLFLFSQNSFGQLLTAKHTFTKYDTLKGGLLAERTCYDVKKYILDLNVDIDKKTIEGKTVIKMVAVKDFTKIQIDLFSRYKITKLNYKNKPIKYTRDSNHIFVLFPTTIAKNTSLEIEIEYSGSPLVALKAPWDGGFVWSKDSAGNSWVGVACEGLGASSWWPCKDHWSDEPDSGIIMRYTVPLGYTAVGNGKLTHKDIRKEYTTFEWTVTSPINLYDVTLNIAKYHHFDSKYFSRVSDGVLDLDFYVLPEHKEEAKVQFYEVVDMLSCFESKFGVYPFYKDGYKLVETPYLGMEHQSCIAYGNKYKKGYLGDLKMTGGYEFDYIIIHESGHEWFGNNITAADNADMWIHEGFTTYSESVYIECLYGKDSAVKYVNAKKGRVKNKFPIQGPYGVAEEGDGDMYNKGSLMINTLRHHIDNETIWSTILKDFNTEFRHKTIDYNDVVRFFESKTNMDLKKFFSQYVQQAQIPILKIKKVAANEDNNTYELKFEKTVPNFKLNVYINNTGIQTKHLISDIESKIEVKGDISIDETKGYFKVEKE